MLLVGAFGIVESRAHGGYQLGFTVHLPVPGALSDADRPVALCLIVGPGPDGEVLATIALADEATHQN